MGEMVGSAVVQEAVSRVVSFLLGKREEKASQGHLMERLEMAATNMEHALERSAKLPITDVSLLRLRKKIKCAYVEAMGLLDKHRQQEEVPAGHVQEEFAQAGAKRKRPWIIFPAKNLSISSSGGLSTDDVRRFEWFADCAGKFVRDVESGCSLRHYTFCNPIVRHLLEGKSFRYLLIQGNQLRYVEIRSWCSEKRGVEARLWYIYSGDSTVTKEKQFKLSLLLRLSASTDIVGVATKGLQFLKSQFKDAAESAMGELCLLPTLLQDIDHWCLPSWGAGTRMSYAWVFRQDPTCCGASRHGLCSKNNASSELSHIFPEPVILFSFDCYYISAGEPRSRSSSFEAGRSISSRGWASPLAVSVAFEPHFYTWMLQPSSPMIFMNDNVQKGRDVSSIQQVSETLKSDAINCFLSQPELTEYKINWYSEHGTARFVVEKPRTERTRRKYNTRGTTKQR